MNYDAKLIKDFRSIIFKRYHERKDISDTEFVRHAESMVLRNNYKWEQTAFRGLNSIRYWTWCTSCGMNGSDMFLYMRYPSINKRGYAGFETLGKGSHGMFIKITNSEISTGEFRFVDASTENVSESKLDIKYTTKCKSVDDGINFLINSFNFKFLKTIKN